MTLIEKLAEKYKAARGKAGDLLRKYHEHMDAGETEDANAVLKRQERAFAEATAAYAELERARTTASLPDVEVLRRDTFHGAGSQERDEAEPVPSPMQLAERQRLIDRRLAGDALTETETVASLRQYRAERLFVKRLRVWAGRDEFTPEEARMWAQYQASAKAHERGDFESRAYTNVMNLGDGAGAEVIPTVLQSVIWPDVFRQGPLADDGLVTVIRLPWEAKADIPLLGGNPRANVVAAGVDGAPVKPTTSKKSFDPHKYAMHVPLAAELLVGGGYTNIEQRITQWIAKGFGIAFNDDGTNGDGSSKMRGITADAGNTVAASKAAITAAEVRKVIVALGEDYLGRPGTRFMCTLATENAISILRDKDTVGSEKAFPVNNEGRPVLPYGLGLPTWNRNLGTIGTGSANVAIVGDMEQYVRVHVGGMRMAREYDALSDSYLLAVFQSTDGKVVKADGFKRLSLPA